MRQAIEAEPLAKLDYLAIVNPANLEPVERVTTGTVALVAARVGTVRLIDNLIFGPLGSSPELLLEQAFASQPVMPLGARIPGLETEALRKRIESCRDCAAISSVHDSPARIPGQVSEARLPRPEPRARCGRSGGMRP